MLRTISCYNVAHSITCDTVLSQSSTLLNCSTLLYTLYGVAQIVFVALCINVAHIINVVQFMIIVAQISDVPHILIHHLLLI